MPTALFLNIAPLLDADLPIQIHVAFALTSIPVGAFVVLRRKRDQLHRICGYIWVLAMGIVALSGFWIHTFPIIGPFNPIHLFSVWTLWSLWVGVRHAVRGRVQDHQATFRSLYWYGLLVAGTFTFLPGRRMNRVVFGEAPDLSLWFIGAVGVGMAGVYLWRRKTRQSDLNAA
ncbi:DUF2306 domain-containing protein [Jannaschia sp. CCS1]|uniref:DUF2306 domain-containing protein n=1 Tax=Jannaschia sp. (strain CCS1) TaxID=290400 RepID=UPI000053A2B9|nr:DUF2306 domain-containing protein [Jannaschia sp. CCS1]ABD54171.1 membrane protein-like protein [Jannaschia sp. CCS1]